MDQTGCSNATGFKMVGQTNEFTQGCRKLTVVTRDELQAKLWPADTFVDFDRGLNKAINKLREALGDSADDPRFIETLHKRGYKFIAHIEDVQPAIPGTHPALLPRVAIAAPEEVFTPRPVWSRPWPWLVAAVLIAALAVVAALGWWRASRSAPLRPLVRLSAELPPGVTVERYRSPQPALSPDGTRLAVSARDADGKFRLLTRRLDESQFAPLSGTEGATMPFFSPDGQWIAYFAEDKLKKVAVHGGSAITLCDAPTP
jgi:hypothetical protein